MAMRCLNEPRNEQRNEGGKWRAKPSKNLHRIHRKQVQSVATQSKPLKSKPNPIQPDRALVLSSENQVSKRIVTGKFD